MTALLYTLVSFNGSNGDFPEGGLIADANGDLFGTTLSGGADGRGTLFEIVNNGALAARSYASTPTTLLSLSVSQYLGGNLIADANGDLFGLTWNDGANGDGTVSELAKTASGYASAPTTLVSFNGDNGQAPTGSLVADANGDLFGTTGGGGAYGESTLFEIVNNGAPAAPSYATTPTTLVSFNYPDYPSGILVGDANGDLFGTTSQGGADGYGSVFEIAKTASGYASTPTTLVSFGEDDGLAAC